MWAVLLVAILLAFSLLKYRETFVIKYGNPFAGQDILSFDPKAKGNRLFGTWPDTCPYDRREYDAGLCYRPCDDGYHGIASICSADTKFRGIGRIPFFKSCSEMGLGPKYQDHRFTCWKNLSCEWSCNSSKRDLFGRCYAWDLRAKCEGPDLKLKERICPGPAWAGNTKDHTSVYGSLCYKQCPKDKPNVIPGLGHLCYKGNRGLSYDRGAGTIPPIYTFAP
jgi:hypothetical protein